jgi:hypothetical protein
VVKAINKRYSKDLQAAVDGYCKFWGKDLRGDVVDWLRENHPQLL